LIPEKKRYWDEVAKTWQRANTESLWRSYSDSVNTELFSRWLPNVRLENLLKTDLFDESLGDGLYPLLSSRAKNLFGIDLSQITVQAAKWRHPCLKAIAADVRSLPFATGMFDFIVSNSTLDHFQSQKEIVDSLRELHRALRAGGQLLLTLDNLANPVIAVRSFLPFPLLNRLNIVPYYVGPTFGPRRLCRYLQETGFEVHEVEALMHFPRLISVHMTRKLERRLDKYAKTRLVSLLMGFERLAKWPTRFLTGYFIAVRAIKR